MASGAKVAIGIGVAFVLLAVGTCGGFVVWLQANKDELMEQGKAVTREGASFGSGQDASVCVTEGLRRLSGVDGIVAEATNKIFVESCLKTARVEPAFCADIPRRSEIMASATWALERCSSLGMSGSQQCSRLVGAIQQRCLDPRAQDAPAPAPALVPATAP